MNDERRINLPYSAPFWIDRAFGTAELSEHGYYLEDNSLFGYWEEGNRLNDNHDSRVFSADCMFAEVADNETEAMNKLAGYYNRTRS